MAEITAEQGPLLVKAFCDRPNIITRSEGHHRHRVRTLLVTGHTGFVGRAMQGLVRADCIDRRLATLPNEFDVRSSALADFIAETKADDVIHLAALTSVSESFLDPEKFFDVNFNGTWNLLKALRSASFAGRLLFVSSADCYGVVPPDELPIRETQPLRPRTPYAVSKVAAEALCQQWAETEGLDVVLARAFNHIGPGQDVRFAIAWFAKQIANIRNGTAPPRIVTGDLGVTRDLSDVRDVARAYISLLDYGRKGEVYNVGSGREVRLSDVLQEMLDIANVKAEIVTDLGRIRTGEQRRAVADVRKIASHTGWSTTIPLATTLTDVLDYWGRQIERE